MERNRYATIAAAWLALATPAPAQDVAPPAPPLSDGEVLQLVSQDARMTVPVRIGAAGPWPFIIDTGAQRTVISRELANVLQLSPGRAVRVVAMSGTGAVTTALIPALSVASIGARAIEAPALPARNIGAAGLLGIDTLQDKTVAIDFTQQTMTVRPATRRSRSRPPAASDEIIVRARNLFGQLVVTDATYRGRQIRVVLDTGTATSVGNLAFQKLAGAADTVPVEMTSVLGQPLTAQFKRIGDVTFGTATIRNLPVAFADAAPFRQFRLEKRPALMLGMDALALFERIEIDFPNRELRLIRPRR